MTNAMSRTFNTCNSSRMSRMFNTCNNSRMSRMFNTCNNSRMSRMFNTDHTWQHSTPNTIESRMPRSRMPPTGMTAECHKMEYQMTAESHEPSTRRTAVNTNALEQHVPVTRAARTCQSSRYFITFSTETFLFS